MQDQNYPSLLNLSILILGLLLADILHASEYTPYGLYDVKSYTLPNGLEVYLNERHESRNTSIRLVVEAGLGHFPCGKTEIAHFIEHLIFTGTSRHTEIELDALIEDNGGYWNATTNEERTIYEVDIYSPYTPLAINTLFEIFTDTTFTKDNVELTRGILSRELGGPPTAYGQWLYDHDIGKSGLNKSNEIIFSKEEYCAIQESINDITLEDLKSGFEQFYVPNNMALIVVGDFKTDDIIKIIEATFGKMKKHPLEHNYPRFKHTYYHEDTVTGTLSPVIGNSADIWIRFRIPGYQEGHFAAWQFLAYYLETQFYNELRVKHGLVYESGSDLSLYKNVGVMDFYAESKISDRYSIDVSMLKIADKLIDQPLMQIEFDRIRRSILLGMVGAYQSNSDLAEYYAGVWQVLLFPDRIVDIEELYQNLTPKDIQATASKYLSIDRAVIVHEAPTITYNQLYIGLGVMGLLAIFIIIFYTRYLKLSKYSFSGNRH